MFSLVPSIDQLSERRSDGVAERSLSEDARSGLTRKEVKTASLFLPKKLFSKEALGNACIKWLPVLYYECSRLNGLWSPFGRTGNNVIECAAEAKWPVEPVRD